MAAPASDVSHIDCSLTPLYKPCTGAGDQYQGHLTSPANVPPTVKSHYWTLIFTPRVHAPTRPLIQPAEDFTKNQCFLINPRPFLTWPPSITHRPLDKVAARGKFSSWYVQSFITIPWFIYQISAFNIPYFNRGLGRHQQIFIPTDAMQFMYMCTLPVLQRGRWGRDTYLNLGKAREYSLPSLRAHAFFPSKIIFSDLPWKVDFIIKSEKINIPFSLRAAVSRSFLISNYVPRLL